MPKPGKLNLYVKCKADYVASKTPVLITIKPAQYLALEGQGAPGGQAYRDALETLYGMAFQIKMNSKFDGLDYSLCKIEALWWGRGGAAGFASEPREAWRWQLLMRTPDFIGEKHRAQAIEAQLARGKPLQTADVALITLDEGRCVQMLHVGTYDQEAGTLAAMREFAAGQGLQPSGRHHEVYLSDPRRVPPERLRTLLRQPVR